MCMGLQKPQSVLLDFMWILVQNMWRNPIHDCFPSVFRHSAFPLPTTLLLCPHVMHLPAQTLSFRPNPLYHRISVLFKKNGNPFENGYNLKQTDNSIF